MLDDLRMRDMDSIQDEKVDLRYYFRILKRRKLTIILWVFFFLIIGIYYSINATPIYQATAKIQADPVQPNATAQDTYIMNSMVFLFYETQYEIIQSRKVAESVVDKLGLVSKYKKEILEQDESQLGFLTSIKTEVKNLLTEDESESVKSKISDSQIRIMLADSIRAGIIVEGGTQSQIINISYQDEDPELAADIINAISGAYIQFGLESRLGQIKDTADWLGEQLQELRINLQKSEDKLRDFRLSENLIDTEQQQRIANTQLQTLNTELVKAQTALSGAGELLKQVEQVERDSGDYSSLGPVLQNNTIRDLVREETTLNRKVKELNERYGEKHPKMIAARSDLAVANSSLNREIEKIISNIRKEYRLAQTQEANIKALIRKTTEGLQSYQAESFELTRLEREVENNRRIYESFLNRSMEADVSGEYDASNIRIIDEATVPTAPVKPRVILILVACLFFGMIFGVVYAFWKELFGNVFRTPDEIEHELSIPSMGVTPLVPKRSKAIKPALQYISDQRSTFSEAINTIRTGLLFSNIDNPPKTVLITSTSGSEGKTTLSINLAVALSQLDETLLIEMDLRKPAVARELGLLAKPGLCEHLIDSAHELLIQKVKGAPNLHVVTCGSIPVNPMELIASNRFSELLKELKTKFKYIVIDSPPTLPVSDSCMIAKMTDVTLLAVKAEETKTNMVKEALKRLNKVNADVTGVVLTQASAKKMSYYGEHYYQDTYYGEDKK